jgi:hypothetical protein
MTGKWSPTGALIEARYAHTATLLPSGQVLVVGGQDFVTSFGSAEVYDATIGQWTATGSLSQPRHAHTATLLLGEQVVVAGGESIGGAPFADAEVYNPGTGRWTYAGSMGSARSHQTATLLAGGQVLVTGGGSANSESFEETGVLSEWRPVITSTTGQRPGEMFTVRGQGFRGTSEASSGNTQDSATNVPLVSLMSVEGGRLIRLASVPQQSFSDTEVSRRMPTVAQGHYILSVMTNAIHGGQMVSVEGLSLQAPVVSDPDGFVNEKMPALSGTATEGSEVAVWLDGTLAGKAPVVAGEWSFTPATELGDGGHEAWAIATDEAGNVSPQSKPRGFTVDTIKPKAPEVTEPGAFAYTRRPTLRGEAELGSKVTVWLDGIKEQEDIPTDGSGRWSLPLNRTLDVREYVVTASATDAAGNESSASDEYRFVVQRSHYGWGCTSAPELPTAWTVLSLALALRRRRLRSS